MTDVGRWNHNIHYHPVVLAAVPPHAERALDVGCGDGMLARKLRRRVPRVVGIDKDAPSIRSACDMGPDDGVDYVVGDFLTHPFEPRSFDVVVFVASLHHMDARAALGRTQELLRPGGRLAVIGLGRSGHPFDAPFDVAGHVAHRLHTRRRTEWEHAGPIVWPPPMTFRQMRHLAARELRGSSYRRRALWRYSLVWTKPEK